MKHTCSRITVVLLYIVSIQWLAKVSNPLSVITIFPITKATNTHFPNQYFYCEHLCCSIV